MEIYKLFRSPQGVLRLFMERSKRFQLQGRKVLNKNLRNYS